MHSSLPAFVDEAAEYEIIDGLIRVNWHGFTLVAPVHIYQASMLRAEAAIARWHLGQLEAEESNVIALRA